MREPSCFLCQPNPELVFASGNHSHALVGLGPITDTYAIIAARHHVRSFADLLQDDPEAIRDVIDLRERLQLVRGPLLMTEHGRVPVCRDDGDHHESHCFHAHALLFQSTPVLENAKGFYESSSMYPSLFEALHAASKEDSYLLISESDQEFAILSRPLNAPRQLTRTLVAIERNLVDLADWRTSPNRTLASELAASIRKQMGGK